MSASTSNVSVASPTKTKSPPLLITLDRSLRALGGPLYAPLACLLLNYLQRDLSAISDVSTGFFNTPSSPYTVLHKETLYEDSIHWPDEGMGGAPMNLVGRVEIVIEVFKEPDPEVEGGKFHRIDAHTTCHDGDGRYVMYLLQTTGASPILTSTVMLTGYNHTDAEDWDELEWSEVLHLLRRTSKVR